MQLPPFVIESITLQSWDTFQDDHVGRRVVVDFETQDLEEWFPVIKSADGFALDPDELAPLASFIEGICKHNDEQGAKRI